MVSLFGSNSERRALIDGGLRPFLEKLGKFKGVEDIFIDGRFVTDKPVPGDIDGYVRTRFQDAVSRFLEATRDKFKRELHVDFYPALTDWEGMGSVAYYEDVFRATSDDPPRLKGYLVIGDWRAHV